MKKIETQTAAAISGGVAAETKKTMAKSENENKRRRKPYQLAAAAKAEAGDKKRGISQLAGN
jgi:hypothetical protein